MKKRLLSILLILCMVLSMLPTVVLADDGEAPAASGLTVTDATLDETTGKYQLGNGTYSISGTGTEAVVVNGNAALTLENASITRPSDLSEGESFGPAIDIQSGDVTLTLVDTNTMAGSPGYAGIHVAESASLTITGSGSLTAKGGAGSDVVKNTFGVDSNGENIYFGGGAGIGGNGIWKTGSDKVIGTSTTNCGTVTVQGGNVNATGGAASESNAGGGAGIGSGGTAGAFYTAGNEMKISIGGASVVTASGTADGAGIGGGANVDGGVIEISGGTVNATGGAEFEDGAQSGGWGGAGIGGGDNGGVTSITISGGKVVAKAIGAAAGIGAGNDGAMGAGTITITGSADVTAYGGSHANKSRDEGGTGIGGGRSNYKESGFNKIEISGNAKVTAYAGKGASAIGTDKGYDKGADFDCNLEIASTATVAMFTKSEDVDCYYGQTATQLDGLVSYTGTGELLTSGNVTQPADSGMKWTAENGKLTILKGETTAASVEYNTEYPVCSWAATVAVEPDAPTFDEIKKGSLVTIKCISPKGDGVAHCCDNRLGLIAAMGTRDNPKYELTKVSSTEYKMTVSAVGFGADEGNRKIPHQLYSADTLTWLVKYENGAWKAYPETPGVDDVVLKTHAPAAAYWQELGKVSNVNGGVQAVCLNGQTSTRAYGLIAAFVYADQIVSVEPEDGVKGSYIATVKVDKFVEGILLNCNAKERNHKNLTGDVVHWRIHTTGADEDGKYVWVAEPVEAADAICKVAHDWEVTFDGNGGTPSIDSKMVGYEEAIGELPTASRDSYTFLGWFTDAENGTEVTADTVIKADQTLYAHWEKDIDPINVYCYFQTVDANGEEIDLTDTEKVRVGLHPKEYGDDGWYVYGKLVTPLPVGGMYKPGDEQFDAVVAMLQNDEIFKVHGECSVDFKAKGNGEKIVWSELNYHGERPYKHMGYSVDGDVYAYHLDGAVTFYNVEFDTNAPANAVVEGLPANVGGYYVTGASITLPTLTCTGYQFLGWEAQDETFKAGSTYEALSNVKFVAKWSPIKYRVHFDANADGKTVTGTMEDQVITYNVETTLNANTFACTDAKDGVQLYTFNGWNPEADGSGEAYADQADFTNMTTKHGEKITLYAQWQHVTKKLTYVSAQGTVPAAAEVNIFSEVIVADAPAGYDFTKYIFKGWRSDVNGLREIFQPGDKFTMPATSVTLTAVWEEIVPDATYTVSTVVDGGEPVQVAEGLKAGETYTINITDPTKDGYRFTGWQVSSTNAVLKNGESFNMPAGNVILTAQFQKIEKYTVTYKIDSAYSEAGTYEVGETVSVMRNNPSKSGYTFLYWRSSHEGKLLQKGDTFEMPNTNVILDAQWQKDPDKYSVTFLDGDTTVKVINDVVEGALVPVQSALTRDGYSFIGWKCSVDGKIYEAGTRYTMPAMNVKMTAVWQADPAKYTVTYDLNGVDGTAPAAAQYVADAFVTVTDETFTKDGFIFAGWRSSFGGTVYQANDTFQMPGTNVTLTAQWQPEEAAYTVSTSVDGTVNKLADGLKANALYKIETADPTKGGYVFTGWLLSSTGTIVHNGDTFNMPAGDVVLTAQWEKEAASYTVTYKNGESSESAGSYKAGEWVTVKEAPAAVEGKTFKGWESNVDGTVYQPGKTFKMPDTNVILTAIWDSKTYTITWKNGDAIINTTTVKHGETPKYIGETPTKDATAEFTYTFSGWTPEPAAATEDATYEAAFTETKRSYTVKFYNADGTLLESKQVEYGVVPKLGRTPKLEGNSQYSYTFKTWSPKLAPVTGDAEYTAVYTRTENTYTVTWVIEGVSTTETYTYNEMPAYKGDTPVKAETDSEVYEFTGWSPELSLVTRDVTYTAQFRTIGKYTVSYDLAGGESATPADAKYAVGSIVTAADVPTRTGYVFDGWLISYESKTVNANGTFTMPATDVTLTAQWTPAYQVGSAYIVAADPKHAVHEAAYSDKLTARKADATNAEITSGVKFILVDDEGHARGTTDLGHGLTLNADGTITGTAMGAGSLTFNVRLANLDNTFVSEIRTITLVIEKAPRTCTVSIENWTYGDEPKTPVVNLSKTEESETITFFYKVKDADDSTYTKEIPVNAGHYTVKAVVGESTNYLGCEATANFEIYKKEIKSVSLSVTAPVACAAAQTTIADGDGFTGTITWTPAPVDGKFDYATEYTATVVLTPDSNHYFTANTTAEGWSVSYDAASGKLTLTHKFEKTELGTIETPVIHPNGGRFAGRQTVKITCATEGAVIHYTTDGTTPTASSPVYDGAFTITETTTVKAIAVKDKYLDSEVASATFTKYTPKPGNGGTTVIPTPAKTELKFNAADHFAYVNGYPDGSFRPDQTVTRAEMMAMINRALERTPKSASDLLAGMKVWSDNANVNAWYYLDVQEATNGHTYTKSGTRETWTKLAN